MEVSPIDTTLNDKEDILRKRIKFEPPPLQSTRDSFPPRIQLATSTGFPGAYKLEGIRNEPFGQEMDSSRQILTQTRTAHSYLPHFGRNSVYRSKSRG
jgi:hypothetical protein